jgi:LPS-assembly protein
MKNNILLIYFVIFLNFIFFNKVQSEDVFNFDVTEVEILEEGNIFKGIKGGKVTTDDGIFITAKKFKYDKILNVLYADGDVIVDDTKEGVRIYTEQIEYLKSEEIILTKGGSKATDKISTITGDEFEYRKNSNILNAKGNVEINDEQNDVVIYAEDITYLRNNEIFFTKGVTKSVIQSKYNFKSKDVFLDRNKMELSSNEKSNIQDDNFTHYQLDKFVFEINSKILKGENILVVTNFSKPKSDKTYFSNGLFNFENKKFVSKNTKILFHKSLFDDERIIADNLNEKQIKKAERFKGKNDPRIFGISSSGDENKTVLDKAIFTSCKTNDDCPPWSLKAEQITHDKIKKDIIYKNAVLNVYDVPVFYFPKFFHPDPSVNRRSGFLQPRLNSSEIVGTSINIPYHYVISDNKDYTFKPTIFDDRIYMFQNEYRMENKNSSFIADFGYTKGYKSNLANNRNGMGHFFSKLNIDLDLKNFASSKLDFFVEKVSMDTFLAIFEDVLLTDKKLENDLKDNNSMTSGLKLSLDHEDYNFTAGFTSYENLQATKNSDRFQYSFPYYEFSTALFTNLDTNLNFSSNGNNTLVDTNNLRSLVTNSLEYTSNDLYLQNGFVNNFGIYFKNFNAIAKNDIKYKSSLQSELLNMYEINTSYPLFKTEEKYNNYLTPKISFRINPSDMKNYSDNSSLITTDNVFSINRLGLSDSYESGKSFTVGLNFKKENKTDSEKYFETNFATIFRDVPEYKIPRSSSMQGTTSNIFGSIKNNFSDHFNINYKFSIDNNLKTIEYNDILAEFNFNKLSAEMTFHEENNKIGDSNFIQSEIGYDIDENNSFNFKTRRNRKLSLTEYYDLVYEYQNDCLTAAIKYKKTYYQDRDLIPKEDLFFTITLFPLTTIDQKIDKNIYRDKNNDIIWK